MKETWIYSDRGISPRCLQSLIESLLLMRPSVKIRKVKSNHFLSDELHTNVETIIFPGGRDIPYHNKLQGQPNQNIRKFVENGGKYLGICAGGYYGAKFIEFEKGKELEVIASRELAFFPGKAIGPAYGHGKFHYHTGQGAQLAKLSIADKETEVHCYYNGGCFFENPSEYKNVKVLAHYLDLPTQPAAIIFCQIGKGYAILSGVHPEYSHMHLNPNDPYHTQLIPLLKAKEKERLMIFSQLIEAVYR